MERKRLLTFTREQVKEHNSENSARIVINNLIYDITEFLKDHPGGTEILLEHAGKDVSNRFYDVGHSDLALQWREQFLIGEVHDNDQWRLVKRNDKMRKWRPSSELRAVPLHIQYGQLGIVVGIIAIIYILIFHLL